MAPPEFKPGMFEPVITIGQRPDGNTRAFHGDKQGLYECAADTFAHMYSTASSRGSQLDMSRADVGNLSKVFAQFLWARNLANQLNKVHVNQGFARELLRDLEIPEPLVKLFNAYGHYEHDQSTYVQLDLEREFCFAIYDLMYMIEDIDLDAEDFTVRDPPARADIHGLNLTPKGDIVFSDQANVADTTLELLAHIRAAPLPAEERLRYTKVILDVATERDLQAAIRWLRMQGTLPPLPQRPQRNFDPALGIVRDRIPGIVPVNGAQPISKSDLLAVIQRASAIMRTVNDELSVVIAPVHVPKYEQGSPAQAAETVEDITYASFPLSLADSTVCAAFKVGRAIRRFVRSAPDDVGSGLRSELIRKSVRRKA